MSQRIQVGSKVISLFSKNNIQNYLPFTAQNFVVNFVAELQLVHEQLRHTVSSSIPVLPFDVLKDAYASSTGRKIFFLDHDGTLLAHPSFSKLKGGAVSATAADIPLSTIPSSSQPSSASSSIYSTPGSSVAMARCKSMGSSLNSWRFGPPPLMAGGIDTIGTGTGINGNCDSGGGAEAAIIELLKRLLADESNVVYLVSGRKRDDLSAFFEIPGLGLR